MNHRSRVESCKHPLHALPVPGLVPELDADIPALGFSDPVRSGITVNNGFATTTTFTNVYAVQRNDYNQRLGSEAVQEVL